MSTATSLLANETTDKIGVARRVFNLLCQCDPHVGITCKEMERLIGTSRSTASARLSELAKCEVIRQIEVVREKQAAYVTIPGATFEQFEARKAQMEAESEALKNQESRRQERYQQAGTAYRVAHLAKDNEAAKAALRAFIEAATSD